jgi:hypothetical protein
MRNGPGDDCMQLGCRYERHCISCGILSIDFGDVSIVSVGVVTLRTFRSWLRSMLIYIPVRVSHVPARAGSSGRYK